MNQQVQYILELGFWVLLTNVPKIWTKITIKTFHEEFGKNLYLGKKMKGVWVFKSASTKYLSNKLSLEVYRWLTTKCSPEQQRGSKYGIAFTLWAIMPSSLYLFPHIANSGSPHCCFAIWPSCQVGSSIFFQSAKTFAPPKKIRLPLIIRLLLSSLKNHQVTLWHNKEREREKDREREWGKEGRGQSFFFGQKFGRPTFVLDRPIGNLAK
jgi:hypothetical protein